MKRLVDRLRNLKDIILTGTNLYRKLVTYICTYLTESIEKINLAKERVRDSDIRALTNQ